MNTPKLTIGMACYDDFEGVYFTTQALRMYHDLSNVELLIVDNKPDSRHGQATKQLIEHKLQPRNAGARYIAMPSPVGTSAPRQRIFDEARGEYVLCIDSHVLLPAGVIAKLIAWYEANPDSLDLLSGPMVYDTLTVFNTHFNNQWRAEMWGTWGAAWKCQCNRKDALLFSTLPLENNQMRYIALDDAATPVSFCGSCQTQLPQLEHAGYEPKLMQAGYTPLGINDSDEFDIPGQGLGLFSCRKSAWLGFNPDFRGFGGEEMYIHTKFRQHGRRCLSLGFLKWVHRFARPDGVKYPLQRWSKLRNYVIGHNELGIDLEPLHQHFVKNGLVTENQWNWLLADPVNRDTLAELESKPACGAANKSLEYDNIKTVDELFDYVAKLPRDLDQHLETLAAYAAKCPRVTEFSKRRESAIGLAKGVPQKFTSYNLESNDGGYQKLQELFTGQMLGVAAQSTDVAEIGECDLLFIDSQHTFARLYDELTKFAPAVKRYIILHDTKLHSEKGEDGGPGLLVALRKFMQEQPQWSVVYHTNSQYGLTVIGCQSADKPPLPSVITMAGNFATAVAQHVASGAKNSTPELLQLRLEQCSVCDQRRDNRCTICGCYVEQKAAMQSQQCPIGKWPMETPAAASAAVAPPVAGE